MAGFTSTQRSKYQWKRIGSRRDRKPRQSDPGDFRNDGFGGRKSLCVGRSEVHDETDDGHGLEWNPADSEFADLDEPAERFCWPHQQPAVHGLDMHAVIADQARERQRAGCAGANEREGEDRFARTCRSTDQHRARADEDRGRVDRGHDAGRRTTKRAPRTFGPSGSSDTPMRFSARMRPPCASTICREIERPSPEFWPKP